MDMRIIALAMLLPLVLLLLIMVFFMGAGHTDKSSHPGLQRNRASHALVGGKKKTGKKHSKAGGGSTSSKTQGSQTLYNKYGGAQDNSKFTLFCWIYFASVGTYSNGLDSNIVSYVCSRTDHPD